MTTRHTAPANSERRPGRSRLRPTPARIEAMESRTLFSTLVVNTLADPASPVSGLLSLREAIAAAQADDTISFAPSLTASGPAIIQLSQGGLSIDTPLMIDGPGASLLSIDGMQNVRPFTVLAAASPTTVSGLSVIDGYGFNIGGAAGLGGGVDNQGTLTLSHCTISQCWGGGNGGGIFNTGTLTLNQCIVSNNIAKTPGSGNGGGIYNAASLSIFNSTISGNTTGAGYCFGGGIYNNTAAANALIVDSTLSGNAADNGGTFSPTDQGFGGAISNEQGTVTLINSTLAGNSADIGGAIDSLGTLSLTNCTVSANSAAHATGGIEGDPYLANNSIISGNTADDTGPLKSASSHNLIGSGTTNLPKKGQGNLLGVGNPKLAPLADNGGPTQTLLPLPNSPAINAGSTALALDASGAPLTTDQRGLSRVVGSAVDIGAVEVNATDEPETLVPTIARSLPAEMIAGQRINAMVSVALTSTWSRIMAGRATISLTLVSVSDPSYSVPIASVMRLVRLRPGATITVNVPIRSLPNLFAGSYDLSVAVLAPGGTTKTVVAAQAVTVDAATAALTYNLTRTIPAAMLPGAVGVFDITAANAGNVAARGILTASLTVTPQDLINATPIQHWSQRISIAAGRSANLRLRIRVPATVTAGSVYLALYFTPADSFVSVNSSPVTVIPTPITVG